MSETGWLIVALAAAATGVGGYALSLRIRRGRLERRLRAIRAGSDSR